MSNNNSIEIERKFLISGFPKVDFDEVGIVKTIYINIKYNSDGKILQEIRIRRWFESGKGYRPDVLTFKSGGTLTRTEIETNLTDNSLFDCFNELGYNPIVKDYRGLYNNGYLIEFNLVDGGTDTAFYYAEVEFNSLTSFSPRYLATSSARAFFCFSLLVRIRPLSQSDS